MTLSELIGDSNLFELINRSNEFPWLTAENCASLNTLLLARYGDCTVVKNMERFLPSQVADLIYLLFCENWNIEYAYYSLNLYKDGDVYEKVEKNSSKTATSENTSTSNETGKKSSYDDSTMVETDNTLNSMSGNSTGTDTSSDTTIRTKKSENYNLNYKNYIKDLNSCSFYDIILLDVRNTLCTFVLELEV